MRVFVAGATGAIGKRLVPRLVARGHDVTAVTRKPENQESLRAAGATPMVLDPLHAAQVGEAMAQAQPEAVVHQLTALSGKADLRHFDRWFSTTNKLRTKATENLLSAAKATGAARLVAQSYTGWNNIREGGTIKTEADPSDPEPATEQRESLDAIRYLEDAVMDAPLEGIVLRFGNFYGRGDFDSMIELVQKRQLPIIADGAGVWSWIHLEDAAAATVAALERGKRGIYNITDDEPARVAEWLPYLADVVGAKRPLRIPKWLGGILAGRVAVQWMTEGRGASNAKAKRELDWQPEFATWRDGFREEFGALEKEAGT
ncbi:MAG: NAD-dependent epimerase/dehydratase family protein [Actinomycetota bacterium]